MAATNSTMLELKTKAPSFKLPDVKGGAFDLEPFKVKKGLVVAFICNHCPYVKLLNKEMVRLANKSIELGIDWVAISANDKENYPQDGPLEMKKHAQEQGYPFPYLFDESQDTAKAYKAACTPDFFLFDENLKLFYRGQFDGSRPGNGVEPNGKDLENAITLLLEGKESPELQIPSIGCNIKWKAGNEPEYFNLKK